MQKSLSFAYSWLICSKPGTVIIIVVRRCFWWLNTSATIFSRISVFSWVSHFSFQTIRYLIWLIQFFWKSLVLISSVEKMMKGNSWYEKDDREEDEKVKWVLPISHLLLFHWLFPFFWWENGMVIKCTFPCYICFSTDSKGRCKTA